MRFLITRTKMCRPGAPIIKTNDISKALKCQAKGLAVWDWVRLVYLDECADPPESGDGVGF